MPRFDVEYHFGIIYKAVNLINNKVYIGQTINLEKRCRYHFESAKRKKDSSYFHKAIRKYGMTNFDFSVLCICGSKEEMNEKERYYITEMNTLAPNGYNLTYGGEGTVGFIFSEEQKEKLRKSHIGQFVSKETNYKKSISMKGKNKRFGTESNRYGTSHSAETKQKISNGNRKYTVDIIKQIVEFREKMIKWKDISALLNVPIRTTQRLYKNDKINSKQEDNILCLHAST